MIQIIHLPSWGLTICHADYYGYRYACHVGRWLVFFGKARPDA